VRISSTYHLVSGGQTGVDRAALDVALQLGLSCGGWCPAGRWAEDGPVDPRYPLHPTASSDPAIRTRRNVLESDALLVLSPSPVGGGTALAVAMAERMGVPILIVDPEAEDARNQVAAWLVELMPAGGAVNVAGPRESEVPGIYRMAARLLCDVLTP
jgi:hypothetical protein